MKPKSLSGNSPEEDERAMSKSAISDANAIAAFNKMISEFVHHSCPQTHICISSVGDGSFLLKALISPFPLFTSVISEEDWFKILGKISISTHDSTGLSELLMGSSSTVVESGAKTPLSDTGTNNLVDPIKDLPSPSPESSSPAHGSSTSFSVSKYLLQKNEEPEVRHPLKVRFHRTGNDKYEVVGSALSTSSGEALDSANEQHCRKTHKKSKKTKKHRVSIDLDHIAYMIDESHLVENREPMVSSHLITENGSSESSMSNGSVLVKELDCSLAKVEKNHNSMDAMATWPTKCDEVHGGDIGEAEASVTHHIWKKKQRRGEPVVKTSYVKRQCTPVTCTIKLRSKSRPIYPLNPPSPPPLPPHSPPSVTADKISFAVVPRRNAGRLKTRYSAPPSSSPCSHPRRATKSASPQCVRRSRYQPVYIDDDIILLCPFMNTRSRDASNKDKIRIVKPEDDIIDSANFQRSKETNGKDGMCIIKEDDTYKNLRCQKPGVGNGRDKLRVIKSETDMLSVPSPQIVKYECGDNEDGLSLDLVASNDSNAINVQNSIKTLQRRRTISRPKKVRPRAGRRTGERVTSDEELPLDATYTSESNSSPISQDRAPEELSSVHSDADAVQCKNSEISRSSMLMRQCGTSGELFAAETDNGSLSDGLYIDEEEAVFEKGEYKSDQSVECQSGQNREQDMSALNGRNALLKGEVKSEPIILDEDSCAVTVKDTYVITENEELVDGSERSGSGSNRRTNPLTHPVDSAVSYRYRMWSNAYRTFCTNPFIVPPDNGQVPQFVRYPSRSMRDVRSVTRDEKCYVKLGLKYEVAVSNPPKEPNERNWKEIFVGDVLWVRWRKNEYWPATAYSISDTAPVKVTVLWINDKTQSTVDYTMVDSFDMAFHIRYDTRRSDPKYVKAVATALRYMGKMGFWERHITAKVYDEIVKEEGESFCRHILPEELRKIKEKSKAPKLAKEAKKDDLTKMQKCEEVLQALQAAHFIDIYHRLPLVGNALPLTQQIVDDYQGSTEYASGNLDPLFVDGSMLSFDESSAFDIDPEVMGSNEIVQWDKDNRVATSGHDTAEASSSDATDDGCVFAANASILHVDVKEVNEEEFPQPFSEIDALRLTSPEKLPPKKRHGARSVTPKPLPKKKRQ